MPDDLRPLLGDLARERRALLALLDGLPPEMRERRPSPEGWSPLEVLEHLARAEGGTLDGLERQIAAGDARKDVGTPDRAHATTLLAALAAPEPIRMPERARWTAPEGGASLGDLRHRFEGYDARWKAVADGFPDDLAEAGLIRHPLAGPMTLADAARFTAAHVARHRRQIERAAGYASP